MREAIVKAGEEFGLRLVGGRAYSANTLESGWIPSPLPAVYTGEKMKSYRQWLPADCYEAKASIGGSFDSPNIEDYYLTPWDLGYGPHVKFDHDFIGREALEQRAKGPHRKKVTLALNTDDVMRAIGSQFQKDHRAKFIEFPVGRLLHAPLRQGHEERQDDRRLDLGGLQRERRQDADAGDPRCRARGRSAMRSIFVWGEENGGTSKPAVERHEQMEMRAIVSPVPYSEAARTEYADGGWRAAHAVGATFRLDA